MLFFEGGGGSDSFEGGMSRSRRPEKAADASSNVLIRGGRCVGAARAPSASTCKGARIN